MSSLINRKNLLEAGAHFGHKKDKMNPKMKRYVYGMRGGVHIIDLEKTTKLLERAYNELKEIAANAGRVLFVGTKKQAAEAVKANAERCGAFYVNSRWLGGTLTNHNTIRNSIDRLERLEKQDVSSMTKKEASLHQKKKDKLTRNFAGIREMRVLPDAIFVASVDKDGIAVEEAHRLGIPVFAIVDTDVDPDKVDFVIPANDDAVRSVALILQIMGDAVLFGKKGELEVVAEVAPTVEAVAVMSEGEGEDEYYEDEEEMMNGTGKKA